MDTCKKHNRRSAKRREDDFQEKTWRSGKKWTSSTLSLFLFVNLIFIAAFIYWLDISVISGSPLLEAILTTTTKTSNKTLKHHQPFEYTLNCSDQVLARKCRINNAISPPNQSSDSSGGMCPDYFQWIEQDLRWWKKTGISREMLDGAEDFAHFRLLIVKGKVYVERFKKSFQTRDLFTIWGILQLMRLYPGKLPDLELLFNCNDGVVINKNDYQGPDATWPPPVFHYCGDKESLDIVFPDWTFWGWAETNIRPWEGILKDIKEGNKRTKWKDRVPYAYWKGNPRVSYSRADLMKCNASEWNSRLYVQEWDKEILQGYKNSKLEDQCTHRYKIFVEGAAWSVSDKYILACDSTTLMVDPYFYDFFLRSLMPLQHYWPINTNRKCTDLKFAVDWGNSHTRQAKAIGKEGSKFIHESLKMKYVYDYMFHLLSEYAKLLKFEPKVPPGVKEMCSEKLACSSDGLWKKFMVESMVISPSETLPCTRPPPFDDLSLQAFFQKKDRIKQQVENLESEYLEKLNKKRQ
ncbi:hypothetical protein LWI29_030854 [Acer saccharum]|uniref:Glycosyl transferase CAP10 domain-containing protein n=1 Tax=Acer saccharum TaxID=4024 RepID=A0AA39S0Z3_ACESA|nr:hypothetical protein LWI29_030854 [Acer saccharum]